MMMEKPRPAEEEPAQIEVKEHAPTEEPQSTEDQISDIERRINDLEVSPETSAVASKEVVKKDKNALLARIKASQEKARKQKEDMERRKKEEEAMLAALEEEIAASRREEERLMAELEDETESTDDDEEEVMEMEDEDAAIAAFLRENQTEKTEALEPSAPPIEHLEEQEDTDFSILVSEEETSDQKQSSYNLQAVNDIATLPTSESSVTEIEHKMPSTLSDEEHAMLVEDQRRILEEIQNTAKSTAASAAAASAAAASATVAPTTTNDTTATRTVQISGGQVVPLHGQEKTREAIKKGTAILVQCVSCQNWMQVTETANLMFCPVCSVVSPVQKQTSVMTKEEAIQESMDRKLAQQLQDAEWQEQNEEGEGWSSWFSQRRENTSNETQSKMTWGEWLGLSSTEAPRTPEVRTTTPNNRPGEMYDVLTGEEHDDDATPEREGLQQGIVAERKPLYSCIVESASTVASTIGKAVIGEYEDEEGNVHGVSSEPLLAVTTVGREQDREHNEYTSLTANRESR